MTAALCGIFFLSGAAALIFETLWFRLAGLQLGNSVWASSLVLAAFMCGLALGNALAVRWGDRASRPLVFYAVMEAVVAVSSLGVVVVLPHLAPVIVPLVRVANAVPGGVSLLRWSVAFLAMLLPATAMGMTLPLLSKALARRGRSFGNVLGKLYGWNTLGAVAGVLTAELLLIRVFGIRGAGLLAASLNLVACGGALLLARRPAIEGPAESDGPTPLAPDARPALPGTAWRLLLAAALVGGAILALEVVWFRFIQLFVLGTTLSFAVMLAVILTGIGLGGLAASVWLRRSEPKPATLPLIALLAGLATEISYAAFSPSAVSIPALPHGLGFSLVLSLRLMLPTAFVSGVLFTLYGHALRRHCGGEAETTGRLTLFNTIGATLGALVGGLVLLPFLGMERSIFVLTLVYGVAALLTCPRLAPGRERWALVGGGTLALVCFALFPFGLMNGRHLRLSLSRYMGEGEIVAVREGLNETATLIRNDWGPEALSYRLVTNAYSMSATLFRELRYMKLFVYWATALRPESRHALLISYGVGTTASALHRSRTFESVDVVDISREIVGMSDLIYRPEAHPLRDPRFRVHIEDGRFFLLTTGKRYDLITGEPPPPKGLGIINLYTREFFQLVHGRLTPGGVATYWLPINQLTVEDSRAITRAFCDVFADCSLWRGAAEHWMLAGSHGGQTPVSDVTLRSLWGDPEVAPDLVDIGVETPEQLGALFIADRPALLAFCGQTPPLVDDQPGRLAPELPDLEQRRSIIAWANAAEAAVRFESSAAVERVWPETLRRATRPYFALEGVLEDVLLNRLEGRRFGVLDGLLRSSSLRTLPLLMLGSEPRYQEIARLAAATGIEAPGVSMELGIGHLARREYAEAARRFQDASRQDPGLHVARLGQAFALFYQDQGGEALQLLRATDPARLDARWFGRDGRAGHQWLSRHLSALLDAPAELAAQGPEPLQQTTP